jgi:hypothetical protein
MAALTQQISTVVLGAASAIGGHPFVPSWSAERTTVVTHEAVARLHSSNRPSIQAAHDDDEVTEFAALPLVAAQTVRVRFRDTGPLPPMDLEDEVGEFIDD